MDSVTLNAGSTSNITIPAHNSATFNFNRPTTSFELQVMVTLNDVVIRDPSLFNVPGRYDGDFFYFSSGVTSFTFSSDFQYDGDLVFHLYSGADVPLILSYSFFDTTKAFLSTISVPMSDTANISNLGGVLFSSLNFVLPLVASYFAFRYIYNKVRKRFRGAGV